MLEGYHELDMLDCADAESDFTTDWLLYHELPEYVGDARCEADNVEEWLPSDSAMEWQDYALNHARAAIDCAARQDALSQQIARLQNRKAALARAEQRHRAQAQQALKIGGITKAKAADVTVSLSKERTTLVVENEAQVRDEFIRMERRVLKAELQRHFKATGEIPEGCELETKQTLTIRR